MSRYFNPQPKKEQVDRGTPAERRQKEKAKAEATKGQRQEHEVARVTGGKVNNQRREGGGLSNPDVEFGRFYGESKAGSNESIRGTIRKHKKTVPSNRNPFVVFVCDDEEWITYRLKDDAEYIEDRAEALGYLLERAQP